MSTDAGRGRGPLLSTDAHAVATRSRGMGASAVILGQMMIERFHNLGWKVASGPDNSLAVTLRV